MSIIHGNIYEPGHEPKPPVVIMLPPGEPPVPIDPAGWRWKLTLPIAGGGAFECEQYGAGDEIELLNEADIVVLIAHLEELRAACWSEAMAGRPAVMTAEQMHALTINQEEAVSPAPRPWWRRWLRC